MREFHLTLTDEEKRFCKELARYAIACDLGRAGEKPVCESDTLRAELGAFVTLKKGGQLRGCMGNVTGDGPLAGTIERMARVSAFEDPRFPRYIRNETLTALKTIDIFNLFGYLSGNKTVRYCSKSF